MCISCWEGNYATLPMVPTTRVIDNYKLISKYKHRLSEEINTRIFQLWDLDDGALTRFESANPWDIAFVNALQDLPMFERACLMGLLCGFFVYINDMTGETYGYDPTKD